MKDEPVHHQMDHSRVGPRRDILAFLEGFYNRQPLHQSLAELSPLVFEQPTLSQTLIPRLCYNPPSQATLDAKG